MIKIIKLECLYHENYTRIAKCMYGAFKMVINSKIRSSKNLKMKKAQNFMTHLIPDLRLITVICLFQIRKMRSAVSLTRPVRPLEGARKKTLNHNQKTKLPSTTSSSSSSTSLSSSPQIPWGTLQMKDNIDTCLYNFNMNGQFLEERNDHLCMIFNCGRRMSVSF